MGSPIDFLLERVIEIETLAGDCQPGDLEKICAAALVIVYHAPSGAISQAAGRVATAARVWAENPAKARLYKRPLLGAVKSLREALQGISTE